MKAFSRARWFLPALLILVVISSQPGRADTTWNLWVGAQSKDLGRQALAFLPNEIWINQNDSIAWHFAVDEIHTVTFLTDQQVRPPFPVGCPGFAGPSATFDGTQCLSTPPLVKPQTFTVQFTAVGNYKVVCLVHPDMTGTVHVLKAGDPLPHEQSYYDAQADDQKDRLLDEADHDGPHGHGGSMHAGAHVVAVGDGEVTATAGGTSTASLMRFTEDTITIHRGDTIEWDNNDPATPHTITFGTEPLDPMPPSGNVTTDADGARHATLNTPADSAHSGFILAAPQDRIGLPQAPLSPTRFRVTFNGAGTYPYICALHDDLGMKGKVIVK